jgi:hypothetical protein
MSSAAPALPRWLATVSAALTVFGFAGLVLTLLIGFETPNTLLLIVSGTLTFAAPAIAIWHLVATRTLTTAEKRVWVRELTGAEAFSALAEYVRSSDLRASAADAAARR